MARHGICACKFFSKETLRPVTLEGAAEGTINDPYRNEPVAASFGTKMSRRDWGLNCNMALEAGYVVVADEIRLELDVTVLRKVAAPPTP